MQEPPLPRDAHKGIAGRVAVLAGSRWMRGAATLCCRAAGRAGAGLVVHCARDAETASQVFLTVPECVVEDCEDLPDKVLAAVLARRSPHALVAGCGLGLDEAARRLVDAALGFDGPLVIDADALTLLAGDLARVRARSAPTVLTPHPLEAARLVGAPCGPDESSRERMVRELARQSGAIAVLKGAGTLVCDGTRLWRCARGTPAMAKAGSGDVLAGVVGALLARTVASPAPGFDAWSAVLVAVERHAVAGELAERDLSENGVLASDLVERLPAAERLLAGD